MRILRDGLEEDLDILNKTECDSDFSSEAMDALHRLLQQAEEPPMVVRSAQVRQGGGGSALKKLSRRDLTWWLSYVCTYPSDYAFDSISADLMPEEQI